MDLAALESEYRAQQSAADAFATELALQLTDLIEAEGVRLAFPLQSRVKSWPSILEKLSRRSLIVSKIHDVTDLVGVRVVVQFQRDLPLISELIWRKLRVLTSEDTAKRLQVDQFGYASTHFIVTTYPKPDGSQPHGGIAAEVQVRTTAQHIWASASHVLQYKHENDVPPEFRRALSRISAFLEAADQEFDRLLAKRDEYDRAQVAAEADVPLNVDVLRVTLARLLPRPNKAIQDDYANLLHELAARGVTTVGQLQSLVVAQLPAALQFDGELAERERARIAKHGIQIPSLDGAAAVRIERGAFATHTGLTRVMLAFEFEPFYQDRSKRRPV